MPFITTENKLRHLVVMTPKKLDIGVAGLEFLSGSRDLLSLPERMPLEFATQLTLEKIKAQRRWSPRPMRHEQALPTQQLANPAIAGTSAFVAVAFLQTHVKGDSETALTKLVVLKCCGKELIESFFYPKTEPMYEAQCGLNLSKVLDLLKKKNAMSESEFASERSFALHLGIFLARSYICTQKLPNVSGFRNEYEKAEKSRECLGCSNL